jgi:hypothetical protein
VLDTGCVDEHPEPRPDRQPHDGGPPPMPRWVRLSLLVVALLAVAVVLLLVSGGHGPSRHGADDPAPPPTPVAASAPR